MRFGPLTPRKWPQDELEVPPGSSMHPPVDVTNADVVRREAFILSGKLQLGAAAAPRGTVYELNLPTDDDGDLWVQQIVLQAPDAYNVLLHNMTLKISDGRTGISLMHGEGVPLQFLDNNGVFTNAKAPAVGAIYPRGFRSTSFLQQPFCFTRQGVAQSQWTLQSAYPGGSQVEFELVYCGWKEYADASR